MGHKKILVLCSGGLDSTVLLYKACKEVGAANVVALNIFYGQKHAKEQEYAEWQCSHLGVTLYTNDLSDVFKFNPDCCALLQGSKLEIDHRSYGVQVADAGEHGTISAYVPYRNGLFLSFAAAAALQLGCDLIYYGAHADDVAGSAYPDCSPEFIAAQISAISCGTADQVTMDAPWWNFKKQDIVAYGLHELNMTHEEFEHTWSCYEGKEVPCGTCGTCLDRKQAFTANGILDIL